MASTVLTYRPRPDQEWQAIKPVFLRLYIDENKTLEDVRSILANQHGFTASVKAFKSHITRWEAFKNYKATEKEKLAQQKDHELQAQDTTSQLTLRGRPIKWDRVARYSKARKTQRRLNHTASSESTGVQTVCRRSLHGVPESLLNYDEISLRAGRDLCQLTYVSWLESDTPIRKSTVLEAGNRLIIGLVLIDTSPSIKKGSGWLRIDGACQALRDGTQSQSFNLFMAILALAGLQQAYSRHTTLLNRLFDYLRNLSLLSLPHEHPLNRLLKNLESLTSIRALLKPLALLSIDSMSKFDASMPRTLWLDISLDLIAELIARSDLQEAQSRLTNLMNLPGLSRIYQCRLLAEAAHLNYLLDNHKMAIAQCDQNIESIEQELATNQFTEGYSDLLIASYCCAALCYEEQGDMLSALCKYRLAIDHGISHFGQQDAMVCYDLNCCTRMLEDAGMWQELAFFKQQYPFYFEDEADVQPMDGMNEQWN